MATAPFVFIVVVDLVLSTLMLASPPQWLTHLMELTPMPLPFKAWLLMLAVCGFAFSWVAEERIFPSLAQAFGYVYVRLRTDQKKPRRKYKVLLEDIRN